jgi:hypothetical protein
MIDFWKIFSVFITSVLGFGKVSVPSAVALFNFNFWKVILTTCGGGLTGVVVFTNVSAAFLRWWNNLKHKYFSSHKHPRVFTRTNRFIIKVKQKAGLWGIATFTPILLSIPFGAFVAERFYKDKKKVILALGTMVLFWNFAIYFLLLFFYETVSKYL